MPEFQIPWAELWYNTTYHESIGKSPFEVVYGRSPPTLLRFLANETKVAAVAFELAERDEALSQLKAQLLKAQQQMKLYADKKRRDVQFAVGEWVFLKLRPHRQRSVVKRINQKLSARFYGPFQIMARIGAVAYKLQLPEQSKIHPVFHVSLLKRAVGNYQVQGELPKELENNADDDIYPEKVLGSRVTLQNGVAIPQSLIQWKHKNADDVTWEDTAFIAGQFPDFKDSLEDKALFETGGIDGDMGLDVGEKPKLWRVYSRRSWKSKKEGLEFNSRIIGLTGPVAAIRQMAQEYRVYFKKVEEDGGDYLVDSSHNMYLLNPNMEVVRCFGVEYNAEQLSEAIWKELNKKPS
ncbi:hypothetical protein TSUD_81500 [Trifolium subterraneum]|uniref:Tf2-1-like SH3-like domain-containing protein n=1 Tax=Trifolium subterraneum TaxID=3900 RepID=A0A2Z6NX51_TRISU|nr:hypothetical protein TSUD_81500 [Trifolium subterraneum]